MQARCDVGPMTQVAVFKRHRGLQTGHLCCYPALLILAKLLQAFMSLLLTSSCLAEPVHPAPLRGLCSSFDSVGLCNLILHGPLMLSHWVSLTLTGRAQYPRKCSCTAAWDQTDSTGGQPARVCFAVRIGLESESVCTRICCSLRRHINAPQGVQAAGEAAAVELHACPYLTRLEACADIHVLRENSFSLQSWKSKHPQPPSAPGRDS